jgi:hypothetical protein
MTISELEAVLRVARAVGRAAQHIPPQERIVILENLAVLLPNHEAIAAKQTAFMLRKAEEAQLKFNDLLQSVPTNQS